MRRLSEHRRCGSVMLTAFLLLLGVGKTPVQADIYRHVDANGVVHFTNAPNFTSRPLKQAWTFYRKEQRSSTAPGAGPLVHAYGDIIRANAQAYRLEEALVKAVI